jgi:ankyrin repeat protein
MSTTVTVGHSLKPEARLAQAISQFEAELSNEHKASFRALRSKAIKSPPGIQDVMQLTAEIDRATEQRRRCLGPRLTNILQATQQFAALGDILVGGSQNILACAVWTAVRLSLKLIVGFSSYLERLSNLFMTAGRLAPRHEKMALLYPRSSDLQDSLCEYFIVIVRLCHEMTAFARKTAFGKLAAALSDPDLKSYQSDLESLGKMIKGEVTFLMAKRLEDEADLSSRFRAISTKFHKSSSYHQEVQTKQRVLDFCSQYDNTVSWKQIRKAGNTTLFRECPEYRDWKASLRSSTIVFTGKLGSGKSVLMANIVDDLHIENENATVAYFFCRHDISESLKSRTVIGSLARQLLQPMTDFTAAAGYLDQSAKPDPFERIIDLVFRSVDVCSRGTDRYLIVDGLDELDNYERNIVAKYLKSLQHLRNGSCTIRLCLSLREYSKEASPKSDFFQFSELFVTPMPNNTTEIEGFIQSELETRIESGKLTIGNPTLILEIQDALLKGSEGMFLWVALQMESLCSMESDKEIRHALTDLPKDLSETFARALRSKSGSRHQKDILAILSVAQRPLVVQELREALCVVPGDLDWNPSRLLNNIYSTLASCGSLITIDEEQLTVHLIHPSVKQFLLGEFKESTNTLVNSDDAHRMMAEIIITYLNYSVFQKQVSKHVMPELRTGSLPSEIIRSTMKSSTRVQKLAIKLLRSRKDSDFDIGKVIAETASQGRDLEQVFYFYDYANSYLPVHVVKIPDLIKDMQLLFARLIGPMSGLKREMTHEDNEMLLEWAVMKGYLSLVPALNHPGRDNSIIGFRAMQRAARDGDDSMVHFLLDSINGFVPPVIPPSWMPIHLALRNGHISTIELLLASRRFDINARDPRAFGRTPLHSAAINGLDEIFALLLLKGADFRLRDDMGRMPLHLAAMHGRRKIIEYILVRASNSNDADEERFTPLHLAVVHGHSNVVKALLDHPLTDPSIRDDTGRMPLHLAAVHGHREIVKYMLVRGSDSNDTDKQGQTSLHLAVVHGHLDVVKVLLDHPTTDPSIRDKKGCTAEDLALENPNLGFVAHLDTRLFSSKKTTRSDLEY